VRRGSLGSWAWVGSRRRCSVGGSELFAASQSKPPFHFRPEADPGGSIRLLTRVSTSPPPVVARRHRCSSFEHRCRCSSPTIPAYQEQSNHRPRYAERGRSRINPRERGARALGRKSRQIEIRGAKARLTRDLTAISAPCVWRATFRGCRSSSAYRFETLSFENRRGSGTRQRLDESFGCLPVLGSGANACGKGCIQLQLRWEWSDKLGALHR
jgi:hypothetical protein